MALVTVRLNANLKPLEDQLVRIADAQVKQAATLDAIFAKLNEPDPGGGDDAEVQARIDEITEALKASNDKLEAAGHPPVPVPEARRLSRSS